MFDLDLDDKKNLQIIVEKVCLGDLDWFENQGILVGQKGNYCILNYINGVNVNDFNLLSRGLIVDTTNKKIVSMPFKRFGNYGEDIRGYKTTVDFSRSEVLEKLDGSMLAVAFPDGDYKNPLYHTRKMISGRSFKMTKGFDGQEIDLLKIAGEYVRNLNLSSEDTNKTLIFELIHSTRSLAPIKCNPN
jgi:hypothetical protein